MSKRAVITGAAGLSVAAVIGGGVFAASFLGGGGTQPEDILPGNTLAFVKVDMDPAAGQKINAFKLAKKFESVDASSKDELKDSILTPLFADAEGIDYAKDIQPWIGDRAALAAIPDAKDGAAPLFVIEFTDEKKMEAGLAKIKDASASETNYETLPPMGDDLVEEDEPTKVEADMAWAVRDNFVVIAEDQATADAAVEGSDVLADDDGFTSDVEALGGDQIITGWVDLEATYKALPTEDAAGLLNMYGVDSDAADALDVNPTGSVVMGVNAQSDHIEFVAKSVDVNLGDLAITAPVPGTGMVADFPADTIGALSISGLGETMVTLYDTLVESGADLTVPPELADQYGITLPDDLEAIFGTDLAVGATMGSIEDYQVFAKVRTADADRAVDLADAVLGDVPEAGDYIFAESRGDHYVAGSSPEALALADAGGLGEDPSFKTVVANAETANSVGFVDIAALVDLFMTPEDEEYGDIKPLDAFGFSVTDDQSNATVTARLSVR